MYEPIEDIEKSYLTPDPWGFQTNPSDAIRKERIIACSKYLLKEGEDQFESCLDIGCGEAWITKDLPAKVKYGYEISVRAKRRWPEEIIDIHFPVEPMKMDLVVATGVLYSHYNREHFKEMFQLASRGALISHIKDWEMINILEWIGKIGLEQIYEEEFPYREGLIQKLRVFKKI